MESIRLGGPAHGIVTKSVYKSLPWGGGGPGGGWLLGWVGGDRVQGWWWSSRWVGRGVVGVQGLVGRGSNGSRG